MKKAIRIAYISSFVLSAISLFINHVSQSVLAQSHAPITICHATHSDTNPYNLITVDDDSIFKQGHDQHQDREDIIPPFDYGDGLHYDGLNWNATGQDILNNGCNQLSATPTLVFSPTPTLIITSTPTSIPTIIPTIVIDLIPTIAPTQSPTPTAIPTPTSAPSTPTPTPTQDNGSNNNTNSNNNNSNNNQNNSPTTTSTPVPTQRPVVAIRRIKQTTVLGEFDNRNPLVEGIKDSYGGILVGQSELMSTAEVVNSQEKLPSGNILTNQKLSIPSLNLNQSVYLPEQIGDILTIGHQEVLVTTINNQNVYYGHNSKAVFGSLDTLKYGDRIIVDQDNHRLTYQITSKKIVSKFDIKAITTKNHKDIFLVTCSQLNPNDRLIVRASLIR